MKEKIYRIRTPKLQDEKLPELQAIMFELEVTKALKRANESYFHWEDLKYKTFVPKKYFPKKELFWTLLAYTRIYKSSPTPICDANGKKFTINISQYSEFLHIIDKEMAGNFMSIPNLSETDKKQFINRNIIEESIASSQLEGANTSRTVAKKMLLEGRKPQNHSEQMIVNNHKTMQRIEEGLYKEDLSWALICELHAMITHQTIPEEKQGALRETLDEAGERLKVVPWHDGTIAYIAPDKEFVEDELKKLIDFANDKKVNNDEFIHPLIKAIMLHFWIGLLHPFEDGNGRLARILFYWYLLKHEYWAFKYLSLSEKIKKSASQYAMAYIYSEQDGCDLTYFIHYNIKKLELARKDFREYLKNKVRENQSILSLSQNKHNLNDRQIKLLAYFYQNAEERINLSAYQEIYLVKKDAAITDLKGLVQKGFLIKHKRGRNTYYYPTQEVVKLFDSR